MFKVPAHWLTERICFLLFGFVALATIGYPQGAAAMHRVSARVDLRIGDYDYLSDYGEWVEIPRFGVVWQPYVVPDWEPFFHGHWGWTNDGWAWISYEPFGWLVYHYGYWYHRPHIGWFWVPGRIWSPARVQWYAYGDYCAWAPLPPPNFFWPDPWDRHDVNVWVMVNINDFTDDNVGRHRIAEPPRREIRQRDVWVRRAPDIRRVETITRRQIPMVKISKERADFRPEATKSQSKYYRPREIERKRMVLPEQELNKVRQHAPQVEREVLAPRKSAPAEQRRPVERKPEEVQKKKSKRR